MILWCRRCIPKIVNILEDEAPTLLARRKITYRPQDHYNDVDDSLVNLFRVIRDPRRGLWGEFAFYPCRVSSPSTEFGVF
jgi:hypothetical protein